MIQSLYRVRYNYINPVESRRAGGLLLLTWVFAALYAMLYLTMVLPKVLAGAAPLPHEVALFFGTPLLLAAVNRAVQSGDVRIASMICVAVTLAFSGASLWSTRSLSGSWVLTLVTPIVASGMLLKRRDLLVVVAIVLALVVVGVTGQSQLTSVQQFVPSRELSSDLAFVLVSIAACAGVVFLFSSRTEVLVDRIITGNRYLETAALFNTRVVLRSDETDLIQQAANDVHTQFNSYFAQILVLNEAQTLVRAARTGLGTIVSAQSDLPLDGVTAISEAARSRMPVLVTRNDDKQRRTHFLPATRSALEIPIVSSEYVYGIIDLQKTEDNAFSDELVEALTLVGKQLGAMIRQARVVQDLQQGMGEQRNMLTRLQAQVGAMQRRGQLDSATWDAYFQGRARDVLGFDLRSGENLPLPAHDIPSQLTPAVQSGELSVTTAGDEQIISIPIMVRGQMIGAMSFSMPKDRAITDRQRDLVQIVSNRLSQALENVRLYEQSQIQASREHKATEVSSVLVTATDVMTLLNTAAERFNEALGAVHTRIELQPGAEILDAARVRSETP